MLARFITSLQPDDPALIRELLTKTTVIIKTTQLQN
jgi:hypothetical protein